MTHGLTGAVAAAVVAEQVACARAVELDFPSGMVRFNTSAMDLTFGGATFLGVGMLGTISPIEESAELRSFGATVTLSGIPRDVVALGLLQGYQGRRGTVWEVQLDPDTHALLPNPPVIFRGRMDTMEIEFGETAQVRVALENRLADWDRPRMQRYTDEDQRSRYPDDGGFRFVSAMAEKEVPWPGREHLESLARRKR